MVLLRLEPNISFEEWASSFWLCVRMANKEASEIMELVEDEHIWRSGVMVGIRDQLPGGTHSYVGGVVRVAGFSSSEGGGGQPGVRNLEDVVPPDGLPKHGEKHALGRPRRQPSEDLRLGADLETELVKLDDHQRMLAKKLPESFPDMVKVGIMLPMLPKQATTLCFRLNAKHGETAKRVPTFVPNDVAMISGSGSGPMGVGECYGDWVGVEESDEEDVGAVSKNTRCPGKLQFVWVWRDGQTPGTHIACAYHVTVRRRTGSTAAVYIVVVTRRRIAAQRTCRWYRSRTASVALFALPPASEARAMATDDMVAPNDGDR